MNPTIAVLDAKTADRRIRVCLMGAGGGLQLISESFSADVGWYVQSSVDLEPEQLAALRGVLGTAAGKRSGQAGDAKQTSPQRLSIYRAG